MPDNIEIDISELKIGNKVYVSEILDDKFKFLHSDNTVVCQVKQSRVMVDLEEDEDTEGTESAEGTEGAEKTSSDANSDKSSSDKPDSNNESNSEKA